MIFDKERAKKFVREYVQACDIQDCVNYAQGENWVEPDDYGNFRCSINFLKKESVGDNLHSAEGLEEWKVLHQNSYTAIKTEIGQPSFSNFPPTYNFPENFVVESIDEDHAEVVAYFRGDDPETSNPGFVFFVTKSDEADHGMLVEKIIKNDPFFGLKVVFGE